MIISCVHCSGVCFTAALGQFNGSFNTQEVKQHEAFPVTCDLTLHKFPHTSAAEQLGDLDTTWAAL